MRLIDADELKLEIIEEGQRSKRYKVGEFWELNRDEIWKTIDAIPTIEERKTGKWLERHHADEEKVIEEWQSCKCSVCGRYDTRPYLYYFSEPRFCSWCGADMRGGDER